MDYFMKNIAVTKWILQRITAVILLPLLVWFLSFFVGLVQKDYQTVLVFFKNDINFIVSIIFLILAFSQMINLELVRQMLVIISQRCVFLLEGLFLLGGFNL